jgi:hypothetical protein
VTPLVEAARDYLSAGLAIIALTGKLPNVAIHPHGLREPMVGVPDGPDDDALLEKVFTHPKTTGVAIVIEAPYVVVDIDGEEGAQQLLELTGTAKLDLTPVARTSRGLHVWQAIAGPAQRTAKLGPKLDLKGVGGYVAAPPSLHPSGFRYEWLRPLVVGGAIQPVMELSEAISSTLARAESIVAQYGLQMPNQPASLDALVRHVRGLEEGNRNNGLHWAASSARDDGFSYAEAAPRLLEAALAAKLDRQEAMTAIRSAYRKGPS